MHSISYQLYSSRNWEPEETFAELWQLGIREVEGFGPYFEDPEATRALLDKYGLSMPSAHVALHMLENEPDRVIAFCELLGIEIVVVPFLLPEDRPKDRAGWQAFGRRLAKAAMPVIAAGLDISWHNHEFEFIETDDGCFPIDEIVAYLDDIKLELDLAWIQVAGQDPVTWLNKYDGRVNLVHLKDIAPNGENVAEGGWADLGEGVMDYAPIAAALRATNVPRWVLEHDDPSDHSRFMRQSYAAALKL